MFRPMRRTKRQLSDADAKELLLREKRGIFAVNGDDGYPFAVPVNYFYERGTGKIYFHGAKSGHKIDALKKATRSASPFTETSASWTATGPPMSKAP